MSTQEASGPLQLLHRAGLDAMVTQDVWDAMPESQRARIIAELARYDPLGEVIWRAPPDT